MVRMERDLDPVVLTGEGLVDRVVHDLVDEVVEAPEARRADVHARAEPDGLEPLQDGDVFCSVGRFSHEKSPANPAVAGHLRASNTVSDEAASPGGVRATAQRPWRRWRGAPRPRSPTPRRQLARAAPE